MATGARSVILLYHRIAQTSSDPWALAVTPDHFEQQLQVLRRDHFVVGLEELSKAAADGHPLDRAIAVTFDDGYLDVLGTAKPLLERYDIPAMVFVPTGMLGSPREFWWDELERVILWPPELPSELRLRVRGREHRWKLGHAARLPAGALTPTWRAWGQPDPTFRHSLFRSVYELLYGLPEPERLPVQNELVAWSGVLAIPETAGRRMISEEELTVLARGPLITIGAHSVTHSLLAAADPRVQQREIVESKAHLESILDRPVTAFAYPFGKRGDYTDETVRLVRQAGFDCACANTPGSVTRDSDQFQLPRIYVFDWNGDELSGQLSSWLGA